MMTLWVVLFALLVPLPRAVAAQTILNMEALQPADVAGVHAQLSASGSLTAGNADVLQLEAAALAGRRGSRLWPRLAFGIDVLRKDDETTVDNRFLHARLNVFLTDRLRTFHFAQLQSSVSLLQERRLLLGSGMRVRLGDASHHMLDIGTGAMVEWERLDGSSLPAGYDTRRTTLRMANVATWRLRIRDGTDVVNVFYVQPAFAEPRDVRVLNDVALRVALVAGVSLDVSAVWRHDSRPPPNVRPNDVRVRTGVRLAVR